MATNQKHLDFRNRQTADSRKKLLLINAGLVERLLNAESCKVAMSNLHRFRRVIVGDTCEFGITRCLKVLSNLATRLTHMLLNLCTNISSLKALLPTTRRVSINMSLPTARFANKPAF